MGSYWPISRLERCFLPYSPLAVANGFLERHVQERGIEHMKLQKLVYFTHGWWLAINSSSMRDERPQVWKHGPVFKTLYHTLKDFGHFPIPQPQLRYPSSGIETVGGDNIAPSYIDFVWQRYGHLSSFALSSMTHQPASAWHRVASEYNFQVPADLEIPDEYVREEFLKIYNEEYSRSGEATQP
jgi:uncharacterized phage-associated protein